MCVCGVVCLSLCVFQSRVQPLCVCVCGVVCLSLCVFQSSFVLSNVREITVLMSVIFPQNQSEYIPSTIFREAGSLFYVMVTSTLVERLTPYGLRQDCECRAQQISGSLMDAGINLKYFNNGTGFLAYPIPGIQEQCIF